MLLLIIFTGELTLKLFGLGWLFWEDAWNSLDLIVIIASIASALVEAFSSSNAPGISAFRLLKIFRVIRLLGKFERLATLVEAFLGALGQAMWVGIFVFIIFYISAVLATGLFGHSGNLDANPEYNSDYFSTVPRTLLSLFQIMTLDACWGSMMRPISDVMPAAWLFFLPFTVLAIGLMNLVYCRVQVPFSPNGRAWQLVAIFIDELVGQTRRMEERKGEETEAARQTK